MTLPYFLRLAGLCLAAFFAVHVSLGAVVVLLSRRLVRRAETLPASSGARLLFAARLLPAALGLLTVAALCVPSYLWLEPESGAERVSALGLVAAALGAAAWSASLWRAGHALVKSWWFTRAWARRGNLVRPEGSTPMSVSVASGDAPMMGIAGLFRPRLIATSDVLARLSNDELSAAIRHEEAHRAARDNWKRLALIATPRLPAVVLDHAWARLTEWAADDEAAGGDDGRAADLASALVCVASLGQPARPVPLLTSLVEDRDQLPVRVARLLGPRPAGPPPRRLPLIYIVSATLLAALGLLANGDLFRGVHQMLEHLTL